MKKLAVAIIMLCISTIAYADTGSKIQEKQRELDEVRARISNYKLVFLMTKDELRNTIRNIDIYAAGLEGSIKELRKIQTEEIRARKAEEKANADKAKKAVEEEVEIDNQQTEEEAMGLNE